MRLKKPGTLGKYRGKLRTSRFRNIITTVLSVCSEYVTCAHNGTLQSCAVSKVRSAVTDAIKQWDSTSEPKSTVPPTPTSNNTMLDNATIQSALNEMLIKLPTRPSLY